MLIERRGVMGVGVCVNAADDSATVLVHTFPLLSLSDRRDSREGGRTQQ